MRRLNLRRFVRAHHSTSTAVGAVEALPFGKPFGEPFGKPFGEPFDRRLGEPSDTPIDRPSVALAFRAVRPKANCRWSLLRMRLRVRSLHRRHEGASEQMGKTRLQDMCQEPNEC